MKKCYKLLTPYDIVEEGDEYYNTQCEYPCRWTDTLPEYVGKKAGQRFFRRKVSEHSVWLDKKRKMFD